MEIGHEVVLLYHVDIDAHLWNDKFVVALTVGDDDDYGWHTLLNWRSNVIMDDEVDAGDSKMT